MNQNHQMCIGIWQTNSLLQQCPTIFQMYTVGVQLAVYNLTIYSNLLSASFLQASAIAYRASKLVLFAWLFRICLQLVEAPPTLTIKSFKVPLKLTKVTKPFEPQPTFWHVRTQKTRISLRIRTVWSDSSLSACRHLASLAIQTAPVKILIRLRECAGWSESSLGVHFQMCVFWHCHTILQCVLSRIRRF